MVLNGKYKFEMIGGEIVIDEKQITQETLENIQDQVLELMSATLKLNKQLRAMYNEKIHMEQINRLQAKVEELENALIFERYSHNPQSDELTREMRRNEKLKKEVDTLRKYNRRLLERIVVLENPEKYSQAGKSVEQIFPFYFWTDAFQLRQFHQSLIQTGKYDKVN